MFVEAVRKLYAPLTDAPSRGDGAASRPGVVAPGVSGAKPGHGEFGPAACGAEKRGTDSRRCSEFRGTNGGNKREHARVDLEPVRAIDRRGAGIGQEGRVELGVGRIDRGLGTGPDP